MDIEKITEKLDKSYREAIKNGIPKAVARAFACQQLNAEISKIALAWSSRKYDTELESAGYVDHREAELAYLRKLLENLMSEVRPYCRPTTVNYDVFPVFKEAAEYLESLLTYGKKKSARSETQEDEDPERAKGRMWLGQQVSEQMRTSPIFGMLADLELTAKPFFLGVDYDEDERDFEAGPF